MDVLITGGAGFIGSHLCDALVARGDKVTVLDNLSTGSKKNIEHLKMDLKIYQGDIRNSSLVNSLVKKNDLILHMAAAVGVNNILNNPVESISINYFGSEIMLNAAVKYNKKIFIASTSEIYGKNPNQPLSEDDDRLIGNPQKFRWSYSDAKALEESMAHAFFRTKNLEVITVRLFNTVGPRQSGNYGMVIPRFVQSALSNKPLTIYGDGSQTRVFCHVKDVVKAVIKLSENTTAIGQVFNIGGKDEISITNLANQIVGQLNSKSKISYVNYNDAYNEGFEEMFRRVPNITKIKNFIGWEPKIGINQVIDDVADDLIKEI